MGVRKKNQARRKQPIQADFGWLRPALALVTVAGSIGGLLLLAQWLQDPLQWPVRAVGVKGELRHLQRPELTGTVSPLAEVGFFAVDVGEIQQRIEHIPWVDQVSVRRAWPDRLVIHVREQQPVARWGDNAFLNGRADVFEPLQRTDLPGLPQLQGPRGYEQRVLAMYRRMQAMLAPLRLEIRGLYLDDRRSWQLALGNGLQIEAGRSAPVERLARFVRFYPAILAAANKGIRAVDLRYSNGFAVQWQAPETQTSNTG